LCVACKDGEKSSSDRDQADQGCYLRSLA
jgi:hypothetical protein